MVFTHLDFTNPSLGQTKSSSNWLTYFPFLRIRALKASPNSGSMFTLLILSNFHLDQDGGHYSRLRSLGKPVWGQDGYLLGLWLNLGHNPWFDIGLIFSLDYFTFIALVHEVFSYSINVLAGRLLLPKTFSVIIAPFLSHLGHRSTPLSKSITSCPGRPNNLLTKGLLTSGS